MGAGSRESRESPVTKLFPTFICSVSPTVLSQFTVSSEVVSWYEKGVLMLWPRLWWHSQAHLAIVNTNCFLCTLLLTNLFSQQWCFSGVIFLLGCLHGRYRHLGVSLQHRHSWVTCHYLTSPPHPSPPLNHIQHLPITLCWPRRLACAMRSLAFVITNVRSFGPDVRHPWWRTKRSWPLFSPTFFFFSFFSFFFLRLLLLTHLGETPLSENLFPPIFWHD